MEYSIGSLVQARGREWVVLPESSPDFLLLRPLVGTDEEVAGIATSLEDVQPAVLSLPDPASVGDHHSCRLLRDALKLGFRSSAGPFRCFARLAVDPRPYQLVPLIMALRMRTVRLLIADDVGCGKTIEAGLVAKELIDRGEVNRLAVLCPPHLAEQWQNELRNKFHIAAELVLSGTVGRLERGCRPGESIFQRYPYVIVSLDFIKSERHRSDFLRVCPELVIVDEAHTCVSGAAWGKGGHQRFDLVSGLAEGLKRHLIMVTATPHSGNETAFRNLLTLLKPEFDSLPEDLSGAENRKHREHLARHFVQRRRGDIHRYMKTVTEFPEREEKELNFELSPEYQRLFENTLALARETVKTEYGNKFLNRIHWWSALNMLRAVGSSPSAAVETFKSRNPASETMAEEEIEFLGQRAVLDALDSNALESPDSTPGCLLEDDEDPQTSARRRKLDHLRAEAQKLGVDKDNKLQVATGAIREMLKEGFHPIVFCRFVHTADYVADHLRKAIREAEVVSVTGLLSHEDREQRILDLAKFPQRVLVCTDCLSEGINLQEHFNAVFHYDLAWNPTRHEQREGRVDRFGQRSPRISVVHYYGLNNKMDGFILNILINKHKRIRKDLGISVPVPLDTEALVQAIAEGFLLRKDKSVRDQQYLPGTEEWFRPEKEKLFKDWDNAAAREKRSRTLFAQESIKVEDVERELRSVQAAAGGEGDVARFAREALVAVGAGVTGRDTLKVDLSTASGALQDMLGVRRSNRKESADTFVMNPLHLGLTSSFDVRFHLPVPDGVQHIHRTHPLVENLSAYLLNAALDGDEKAPARRCGVIRTRMVNRRTTILLLRMRFHILDRRGETTPLLVEDACLVAFQGTAENPEWLTEEEAEALLGAAPEGNVTHGEAEHFIGQARDKCDLLMTDLERLARRRGEEILESHTRVRLSARSQGLAETIESHPPDVLGLYVFLPLVG